LSTLVPVALCAGVAQAGMLLRRPMNVDVAASRDKVDIVLTLIHCESNLMVTKP
jgi:hypothetical protein